VFGELDPLETNWMSSTIEDPEGVLMLGLEHRVAPGVGVNVCPVVMPIPDLMSRGSSGRDT
jgi:hypothetical protein